MVPWLLATIAAALLLVVTRVHGLGLSTDSVLYARAADSLLAHGTLEVPLTWWDAGAGTAPLSHFPPALPAALALVSGALGVDVPAAARWLNAGCLFGTTLAATSWVVEAPFAVLVIAALLAAPSFASVHLWLWSEPLFLLLAVLAFRLGVTVLRGPRDVARTALLGVLCGLATLTRYAGAALFLGFAVLIASSGDPRRLRAERVLWLGAAYAATVLPWVAWLAAAGGAPREWGFFPEHAWTQVGRPLLDIAVHSVVPYRVPFRSALPVGAAAIGVALVLCLRWIRASPDRGLPARAALVLFTVNIVFHVAAWLFADQALSFDRRVLSPAMLVLALGAGQIAAAVVPGSLPVIPSLLVVAVATSNVFATAPSMTQAARHGNGYATDEWDRSETIAFLRTVSPEVTIFSNAPDAICARLPLRAKYTPGDYEPERLTEFAARVEQARPSLVVLFDDLHPGWLLPRERLLSLRPPATRAFPDALVMSWGRDSVP
jgi:hypothetical protein